MKKQEKPLEVEVNGIPDLSKAPKDLLQLFCEAMLEVIELLDKESCYEIMFDTHGIRKVRYDFSGLKE